MCKLKLKLNVLIQNKKYSKLLSL